jgi:hypothetical protein
VIPEIRLVVCANAADNGRLGVTDVGLVTTDRFECDAIISFARAGRAGGVLSISIILFLPTSSEPHQHRGFFFAARQEERCDAMPHRVMSRTFAEMGGGPN